jgi:hypothetical protein
MTWYKEAKKREKQDLTPEEREQVEERFGKDPECSFAKDEEGYFCYTHRARSESYETVGKIPKSAVEFIESTSSTNLENSITEPFKRSMPYVTADSDGRMTKEAGVEQDVKTLKREIKDLERKLKAMEKDTKKLISDLNLGERRFWQQKTVFTTVQRKIERFEKVEQEWKKFKSEMEDKMKKLVEKKHRAQIQ